MRQVLTASFVSFVASSLAGPATFSFGDVHQYVGSGTTTPTMTGAMLAFSAAGSIEPTATGVPKDGVDVFISPELQSKIEDAMKANCHEVNDKCYQSVTDVINTPETELQARAVLGGVVTGVYALAYMIVGMAYLWQEKEEQVVHWHIGSNGMMQISSAISASEIAIATGTNSPSITITPKPEPTTPTGIAPAITTFTSATGGHVAGDVVISLPEDLARRMDEMIRRTGDATCAAATDFEQQQQQQKKEKENSSSPLRRRRFGDLAAVICAAESLLVNAGPGYAFADYLVVHPRALPWRDADVLRAMRAVMDAARAVAPALRLDPATAAGVGVGVFAVAMKVLYMGEPLGTANEIPASMFSAGGACCETCETASAEECFVDCRFIGAWEKCRTTCTDVKSCEATSGITTTTTTPWAYPTGVDGPAQTSDVPRPECKLDEASGMPFNVFNGVFGGFCEEVEKNDKVQLKWTVDSRGNQVKVARRGDEVLKRTPPPNPETYKDYKVELTWTPENGGSSCAKTCADAYALISNSPCGHVAGEQNIMAQSGKLDIGCGAYSWLIHQPPKPEPPTLGDQNCHDSNAFGKHKDIDKTFQLQGITFGACVGSGLVNMTAKSEPKDWQTMTNGAPYHYIISWIDGCTSTETEQNVWKPLRGDDKTTCVKLLQEDYTKCNNGGVGGWRDAGCLRYEFKAQVDGKLG